MNCASTPVCPGASLALAVARLFQLYPNAEEARTPTLIFLAEERPVTACTFRQRLRPVKSLFIHR